MNRSIMGIVNGHAGGGSCGKQAASILSALRTKGISVQPHFTKGPKDASKIARRLWEKGSRKFVVFGGDGTTFEVLNGIFPQALEDENKPTLSTIALGTGNSFLRDLHILDKQAALQALEAGTTQLVDVIQINHASGSLFYLNILGLGFTAAAGDLTNRKFKSLGSGGYVVAALLSLVNLKHLEDSFEIDQTSIPPCPSAMVSFCNSQFTGGALQMAPDACAWDGKIDVVRVGPMSRFELLRSIPKTAKGTHVNHPKVDCFQAKKVHFRNPRKQPVMVDGEILDLEIHSLEVLHHALNVSALKKHG